MGNLTFIDALAIESTQLSKYYDNYSLVSVMLDCNLDLANAVKDHEYDRIENGERKDTLRIAAVIIRLLSIAGKYGLDIGSAYNIELKKLEKSLDKV